jgi:hypothetical protein
MINLFTSIYTDKSPIRQKELIYCLNKNIENQLIDKIYLFVDGFVELPESDKLVTIEFQRPTYRDFFNLIDRTVTSRNDISMVANTDIYFNHTLSQLTLNERQCIALSRWDDKIGGLKLHNERFSQDVWIFRGKMRNVNFCDFYLGIPGCDNRIAYELHSAGYALYNPATRIQAIHYHRSDLHNYDGRTLKIQRPYLFIPVT